MPTQKTQKKPCGSLTRCEQLLLPWVFSAVATHVASHGTMAMFDWQQASDLTLQVHALGISAEGAFLQRRKLPKHRGPGILRSHDPDCGLC